MAILIALLLTVFGVWLYTAHKTGKLHKYPKWFLDVVLYGVRNHSPLGFTILLAVLLFAKLWLLAFATLVLWVIYVAIQKDMKSKTEGA